MGTKTIERELGAIEQFINTDVTLVYMPDLNLCDFQVKGSKKYIVHFVSSLTFGLEFATIQMGNNVFNIVNNQQTQCYLFEDAQLRQIEMNAQGAEMTASGSTRSPAGTATPCTGPIIIPPTKSTG